MNDVTTAGNASSVTLHLTPTSIPGRLEFIDASVTCGRCGGWITERISWVGHFGTIFLSAQHHPGRCLERRRQMERAYANRRAREVTERMHGKALSR